MNQINGVIAGGTLTDDSALLVFGPFVPGDRLVELNLSYGFRNSVGAQSAQVSVDLCNSKPATGLEARASGRSFILPYTGVTSSTYAQLPVPLGSPGASVVLPLEHTCVTEDVYLAVEVVFSSEVCDFVCSLRRIRKDDQ